MKPFSACCAALHLFDVLNVFSILCTLGKNIREGEHADWNFCIMLTGASLREYAIDAARKDENDAERYAMVALVHERRVQRESRCKTM